MATAPTTEEMKQAASVGAILGAALQGIVNQLVTLGSDDPTNQLRVGFINTCRKSFCLHCGSLKLPCHCENDE